MENSSEQPEQTPEGAVIERHQRQKGLSARKAADLAGMSDARWRQIVNGYQSVARGLKAPVVGPAETVARMANVVGAHHLEFESIRPDVFDILFDQYVKEAEERGDIPPYVEKSGEELQRDYERMHASTKQEQAAMYVRGDLGGEDHREDLLDTLSNDDIIEAVRHRIRSLTAEVRTLRAQVAELRSGVGSGVNLDDAEKRPDIVYREKDHGPRISDERLAKIDELQRKTEDTPMEEILGYAAYKPEKPTRKQQLDREAAARDEVSQDPDDAERVRGSEEED